MSASSQVETASRLAVRQESMRRPRRDRGQQAARRGPLGHAGPSQLQRDQARMRSKKVTLREKERIVAAARAAAWAIEAIRRLSRARWPLRGELVPRAIRGGAESAAESVQRSSRPPPQGAGPGTAPSLIQRAQPDISTLLETGHFYLGLTSVIDPLAPAVSERIGDTYLRWPGSVGVSRSSMCWRVLKCPVQLDR